MKARPLKMRFLRYRFRRIKISFDCMLRAGASLTVSEAFADNNLADLHLCLNGKIEPYSRRHVRFEALSQRRWRLSNLKIMRELENGCLRGARIKSCSTDSLQGRENFHSAAQNVVPKSSFHTQRSDERTVPKLKNSTPLNT